MAASYMMISVLIAAVFLTVMVGNCHGEFSQSCTPYFYLANNRALLNHAYQWKTVSARGICWRDCVIDPQCASINYHTSNHVCALNNATRAHSPADFVELQGSTYYDDNLDTPSFSLPDTVRYSSCLMLFRAGHHNNSIYTIYPTGLPHGINVYCDMTGGGWIVFQRRQDGSVEFHRSWTEYKSGFGYRSGEFWLGNDILRTLTGSGQWQLRVDLVDWESNTAWSTYGQFAVRGDKYTLHVGSYDYRSTAGDAMFYHNGCPFTSKDQDNDEAPDFNCAQDGAWWFRYCQYTNLNGKYKHYSNVGHKEGIQWYNWKGDYYSLKKCSMKIREVL